MASEGCRLSMLRSRLVPLRGAPTIKTGRSLPIGAWSLLVVRLLVLVPAVVDRDAAVGVGRHLQPVGLISVLVDIGDHGFGRVMVLAALHGVVHLPDVLQAGRSVHHLPSFRRTAFARAVIHHRHTRMERLYD